MARFSLFQDKEFVWSFIKNVMGSNTAIANVYLKEIANIHKTLYLVLKKPKQKGTPPTLKWTGRSTKEMKQTISHFMVLLCKFFVGED